MSATPPASIRAHLTRRLLMGTTLLLLLAGLALAIAIQYAVVGEFDRALLARAGTLQALTTREGRGIEVELEHLSMPAFSAREPGRDEASGAEYFQILFSTGEPVARSASLQQDHLPTDFAGAGEPAFDNLRLPDGRRGRAVTIAFLPARDDEGVTTDVTTNDEGLIPIPPSLSEDSTLLTLTVAQGRERINRLLARLHAILVVTDLALLGGITLMVRRSVRDGLGSIDAMNSQIEQIGPARIDVRLDLPSPPEELRPTLHAVNALLERLQQALVRERQFSSDVAHELRTPVAELRSACEMGARWPDDAKAVHDYFRDIGDIARQMEISVVTLLELARCDAGAIAPTPTTFALAPLIEHGCARGRCPVEWTLDADPSLQVTTDRDRMEIILHNLIDNAIRYRAPDTPVRIAVASAGDRIHITIANETNSLTPADLDHLCDRFWRKDAARSDPGNLGLGLTIAKGLCDRLGITMDFSFPADRRLQVRLSIPADCPPSPSPLPPVDS